MQECICVATAVLVCVGVYAATHPAGVSVRYAASMALLFGTTLFAARAVALERAYEVPAPEPLLLRSTARTSASHESFIRPELQHQMVQKHIALSLFWPGSRGNTCASPLSAVCPPKRVVAARYHESSRPPSCRLCFGRSGISRTPTRCSAASMASRSTSSAPRAPAAADRATLRA